MKFSILTLGCKVNIYESEAMKELLIAKNYIYEDDYVKSDIIIVNTCSVTNMADLKSKKLIRRLKRENSNAILVVAGCSVQNNYQDYEMLKIDILIGNKDKNKIISLIEEFRENKTAYQKIYADKHLEFESMNVKKFTSQTRAYLKIQDGCNNYCSYCIIPYLRGNIRSKDFFESIEEAKCLVNNGHFEIVLTGIHTGSYNSNNHDLTDLICELSKIPLLKQIRISSIEVTELNEKFMAELKNNQKICDHLHIPLQSGSDLILKKMNRKYNLDYYEQKIKEIRRIRPNISITTDVIVGHPYEDIECFLESYEFCKKINFAKIHVFPYSIRTGTMASKMSNQVSEVDKKERSKKLINLSNELEESYLKNYINKEVDILIEDTNADYSIGHSSNYLKVRINRQLDRNTFYKTKIIDYQNKELIGE